MWHVAIYYDDSTHTAQAEIENLLLTGPLDYFWLNVFGDSIGTTSTSPSLCEGTYFLIVTDISNNCSVTDTFTVSFYLVVVIVAVLL